MPGGRPPATPPPDPRLAKHIERQGTALSTSSCDADDLDVVLVAGNGPVDFEVQDRRPPQRSHTTQQKTCTFRLVDFDSDLLFLFCVNCNSLAFFRSEREG